jgi:hypothetical protein
MLMRHLFSSRFFLIPAVMSLLLGATQALADPPSRVARLSYLQGSVNFQPSGVDQWTEASLNRPLITGDNVYADRAARVEMEIGAATIRLDERTAFGLLRLDDDNAQIELTEGVLSLKVRRVFDGQSYEIDTPTLALVIDRAGSYRVDIAPDGSSTMVTVFNGDAVVYGENNASYRVREGQTYRFHDSALRDYEILDLPRADDFDRWVSARDDRYERSVSRQYVSEEIIGYADLDDHGSWSTVETYGSIWYPSRVAVGWAPYRQGRWSWIDPWGWTWIDTNPWGFAPFHYGRWAYVGSRWGWVPGPRHVRPVYAPALVAFVGGSNFSVQISSGGPVGWFPLGPRDVYVPWYRGSRNYFNNINVRNTTIINNTYITNVYNDYSRGRPITNFNYAYRNNERAFTAVSRDAFINSRAVDRSRVQVAQAQLARGEVVSRVGLPPNASSFIGGAAVRQGRAPSAAGFDRRVIARNEPPPRMANVQTRLQAIQRNGNQPLEMSQMRELRAANKPAAGADNARRIQVVGGPQQRDARIQPLPARAAANRNNNAAERVTPTQRQDNERAPAGNRINPGAAQRDSRTVVSPRNPATERGDAGTNRALPSSRFSEGREGNARGADIRREATPQPPANRGTTAERIRPAENDAARTIRAPQREQQRAVQQRETQPRVTQQQREAQPRVAPQQREEQPRVAPQQRVAQPRVAPQQREVQPRVAPQQREIQQRAVPQQREVQPRQVQPQRAAPQQREVQPRVAPQQREIQQRAAPQQREVQPRQVQPQRAAPQQREVQQQRQAPARTTKEDHGKNGGREPKRRDDR